MTQLRLILLAAALAGCIGSFFYGVSVGKDRTEARFAKVERALRAAVDANISAAQASEAAAAVAAQQRGTVFREIHREVPTIVDRPVYRNQCVDADGVRVIDQAVAAANGRRASAGKSDGDSAKLQTNPPDD